MGSQTPWLPHLDLHAFYHSPLHPLRKDVEIDKKLTDYSKCGNARLLMSPLDSPLTATLRGTWLLLCGVLQLIPTKDTMVSEYEKFDLSIESPAEDRQS